MTYLTQDELVKLLEVAYQDNKRNWLMILVTYMHGLRASETGALTPENFDSGYLTVQRLKHSLKTVQHVVPHVNELFNEKDALEKFIASVHFTTNLFVKRTQFWRIMQKYGMLAGIPEHKRHPHALKHTTAKLALKRNMKIDDVRQYLGHKSLASTGAYLKVDDEEASKAFMEAL